MIDKEKQIEEIAKDLKQIKYSIPDEIDDRYRVITHLDKRGAKEFAASLAEAGYRKQSDTAREILQYLYEKMGNVPLSDTELVLYLATQYGVEVEE